MPISPVPPADNGSLVTGANWKFPQNVASGDPRPDSVLLWTCVVSVTRMRDSTLTEEAPRCEFLQVNRLVGGQARTAPTTPRVARSRVATVRSGVPAVTMG